ncbi:hypothetical protein CYMTET_46417 [Cymbomonas tetramitiformis]|uniref:RWD domain-containing protein n=1 Tax=Cymbomonas tetramitiformis TaxID=36881 RepID=A0AAE0EXL8_9CHLO|nr:hypothetical protein CYMTET_46417 [Cymbomonas tetramitiformis]
MGESILTSELDLVSKTLPKNELRSCFPSLVQVEFAPTAYRDICIKIQFPDDYPQTPLIAQLESRRLHEDIVTKLQVACEKEAEKNLGGEQILPVVDFLRNFVTNNNLIAAFSDIRALRASLPDPAVLTTQERAGTVKLLLEEGAYKLAVRFVLSKDYPEHAPTIEVKASTFPPEYVHMFIAQANEIGRRCVEAGTSEMPPPPGISEMPPPPGLSFKEWKKKDMTMAFVPLANEGTAKHRKAEAAAAAKAEALMLGNQRKLEILGIGEHCPSEAALSTPSVEKVSSGLPSLAPMALFLINDCVQRLPRDICKICDGGLLPANPSDLPKLPKDKQVERIYCGHYYHYGCLNKIMTVPPFAKPCLTCGRRIYHHKWVSDIKVLEKRWATKQAREREIDDVVNFLGP